ncbi:MAG: hypothetical protein K6F99_05655, partial [Lachnospiraceae bacterium]|nr:hypothetical protein [Lachnospiraceae bacterium]
MDTYRFGNKGRNSKSAFQFNYDISAETVYPKYDGFIKDFKNLINGFSGFRSQIPAYLEYMQQKRNIRETDSDNSKAVDAGHIIEKLNTVSECLELFNDDFEQNTFDNIVQEGWKNPDNPNTIYTIKLNKLVEAAGSLCNDLAQYNDDDQYNEMQNNKTIQDMYKAFEKISDAKLRVDIFNMKANHAMLQNEFQKQENAKEIFENNLSEFRKNNGMINLSSMNKKIDALQDEFDKDEHEEKIMLESAGEYQRKIAVNNKALEDCKAKDIQLREEQILLDERNHTLGLALSEHRGEIHHIVSREKDTLERIKHLDQEIEEKTIRSVNYESIINDHDVIYDFAINKRKVSYKTFVDRDERIKNNILELMGDDEDKSKYSEKKIEKEYNETLSKYDKKAKEYVNTEVKFQKIKRASDGLNEFINKYKNDAVVMRAFFGEDKESFIKNIHEMTISPAKEEMDNILKYLSKDEQELLNSEFSKVRKKILSDIKKRSKEANKELKTITKDLDKNQKEEPKATENRQSIKDKLIKAGIKSDELHQDLSKIELLLGASITDLNKIENKIKTTAKQKKEALKQIKDLEGQYNDLNKQRNVINQKLIDMRSTKMSKSKDLTSEKEAAKKKNELRAEFNKITAQLDDISKSKAGFTSKYSECESELKYLNNDTTVVHKTFRQVQELYKDALRKATKYDETTLQQLLEEEVKLVSEQIAVQNKIESGQTKKDETEAKIEELKKEQDAVEDTKSPVQIAESISKILNSKKEEVKKEAEKVEDKDPALDYDALNRILLQTWLSLILHHIVPSALASACRIPWLFQD